MKKTFYRGLAICLFIGLSTQTGIAGASSDTKEAKTSAPAAAQAPGNLNGTVLETMDSGGYTYLQLDTGAGKPWIAIPQAKVAVGDKISCQPGMVMKNFASKTLSRTFDSIVFSSGLAGASKSPHAGMGAAMGGSNDSFASAVAAEGGAAPQQQVQATGSGGSLGAMAPFSEIEVDKASGENAYRVEEAFAQKEELTGKTIRIKGKVVKFSPMIMGRNWVHLQDGTGDPMSNTHDLVITTDATTKEGDIITMEGVLTAFKDFGAGYKYEAIIEKAKIVE